MRVCSVDCDLRLYNCSLFTYIYLFMFIIFSQHDKTLNASARRKIHTAAEAFASTTWRWPDQLLEVFGLHVWPDYN